MVKDEGDANNRTSRERRCCCCRCHSRSVHVRWQPQMTSTGHRARLSICRRQDSSATGTTNPPASPKGHMGDGKNPPGIAQGTNPRGLVQAAFGPRTTDKVLYRRMTTGRTRTRPIRFSDSLRQTTRRATAFSSSVARLTLFQRYIDKIIAAGHALVTTHKTTRIWRPTAWHHPQTIDA